MNLDIVTRTPVTFSIAIGMVIVYLVDPPITSMSYVFLAPWMHAGFDHLWQNLLVFLLLGVWIENRVGSIPYLGFVWWAPYLSLYLPVVFDFGGLSRGASGLTKALGGFVGLVMFVGFSRRLQTLEYDWRPILTTVIHFLILVFLGVYILQSVERFFYLSPRPQGVSVASHFTGLVLGWLWFGYRGLRYGIFSESDYW